MAGAFGLMLTTGLSHVQSPGDIPPRAAAAVHELLDAEAHSPSDHTEEPPTPEVVAAPAAAVEPPTTSTVPEALEEEPEPAPAASRCTRIMDRAGSVVDHLVDRTGVTIVCTPTPAGTRGQYWPSPANRIELNTSRNDLSDGDLARVLLHELGHAWDDQQPFATRQAWAAMRGLDVNDWWCSNPSRPDQQCGTGDLADAIAHVYGGHPMRTHGPLTTAQRQWIRTQMGH